MEIDNVFKLLNEGLWQDYSGFLRNERENNNPTGKELEKALTGGIAAMFFGLIVVGFIGAIVFENDKIGLYGALVLLLLFVGMWIFAFISYAMNRKEISDNAYDIEVTPHKTKMIRNREHYIGLCYWNNYTDNKLLLPANYEKIEKGCGESFIICHKGKYGIYSYDGNKIIADCVFDRIEVLSETVYQLSKNGDISKMNLNGDRVLY